MTTMRTINENLFFVANLQVFSCPYTSLYIDKAKKSLHMFIRISSPYDDIPQYVIADVSSDQVARYMKKRVGLKSLLKQQSSYTFAMIENNTVILEQKNEFQPTPEMQLSDKFDPEYCLEHLKLKVFLNRFNNHQIY